MPKTSKIHSTSSRPKEVTRSDNENLVYVCCRCSKHYKRQKNNFPASQSPIYKGNGGYLPICNECLEELLTHYKSVLGNEKAAMKRICMKFDIYWNTEIYAMLGNEYTNASRIRGYISKTNLIKYVGKTYDDTLDEEKLTFVDSGLTDSETAEGNSEKDNTPIDENVIRYWGIGYPPEMYRALEARRAYWMSLYPEGTVLSTGEDAILRQICNLEIKINKDMAADNPIEKSVNSLNNLLGSMNIKPSQQRDLDDNYIPFGVEIGKFEDDYPIEPDPDFEDVDGIHHNIMAWFLGPLCKTSGIKNMYSDLFEEELKKYTVQRPKYEDDEVAEDADDETAGDL